MGRIHRLRSWEFLAFIAIASTTLSLVSFDSATSQPPCLNSQECEGPLNGTLTCVDGRHVIAATNCSDLCNNNTNGSRCATFDGNECLEALCDGGNCSLIDEFVPDSCNDGNPCTNDTCDVCGENCSGACVNMPINATGCNIPLGGSCDVGGQCTSTFCADGVCCETACDDALGICNRPGALGRCEQAAPAPAITWQGIFLAVCLLTAIGMIGLRRAFRPRQHP